MMMVSTCAAPSGRQLAMPPTNYALVIRANGPLTIQQTIRGRAEVTAAIWGGQKGL